jgi:hypothetical protein
MRQLLPRMFDILIDVYRQTLSPLMSLDRSLAAAYQSHMTARRALAIVIAEEARETERSRALMTKTQDLEQRAVEALRAGRDDLATQAAEAIAAMSVEIVLRSRLQGISPRKLPSRAARSRLSADVYRISIAAAGWPASIAP